MPSEKVGRVGIKTSRMVQFGSEYENPMALFKRGRFMEYVD